MAVLPGVQIEIGLEDQRFTSGLRRASQQTEQFAQQTTRSASQMRGAPVASAIASDSSSRLSAAPSSPSKMRTIARYWSARGSTPRAPRSRAESTKRIASSRRLDHMKKLWMTLSKSCYDIGKSQQYKNNHVS